MLVKLNHLPNFPGKKSQTSTYHPRNIKKNITLFSQTLCPFSPPPSLNKKVEPWAHLAATCQVEVPAKIIRETQTTLWFGRFWGSLAPQLVGKYITPSSLAPPISQPSKVQKQQKNNKTRWILLKDFVDLARCPEQKDSSSHSTTSCRSLPGSPFFFKKIWAWIQTPQLSKWVWSTPRPENWQPVSTFVFCFKWMSTCQFLQELRHIVDLETFLDGIAYLRFCQRKSDPWYMSHTIHVWYLCLHFVDYCGKYI